MPQGTPVEIKPAKGRPMLTWVGKRPLRHVTAFPAQLVEKFEPQSHSENPQIRNLGRLARRPTRAPACSSTATTRKCWPTCWRTASAARSS